MARDFMSKPKEQCRHCEEYYTDQYKHEETCEKYKKYIKNLLEEMGEIKW